MDKKTKKDSNRRNSLADERFISSVTNAADNYQERTGTYPDPAALLSSYTKRRKGKA